MGSHTRESQTWWQAKTSACITPCIVLFQFYCFLLFSLYTSYEEVLPLLSSWKTF